MELLTHEQIPREEIRRSFRYRPWAPLVLLAVGLVLPAGAWALVAPTLGYWPVLLWCVAVPVALGAGLLWLLVFLGLLGALLACFRASNWVVKVSGSGVYLQLRSYLNHHFRADHPTVVFVPFSEIASAGKVRERFTRDGGDGPVTHSRSWLELVLQRADTAELARVLALERTTEAPQRSCLGLRWRTRHRHAPLHVQGDDRIRVDWRPGVLRAFEARVRPAPGRTSDLDASLDPNARLLSLVERGEHLAAIDLVRQAHGCGLGEAKRFLDELQRRPA